MRNTENELWWTNVLGLKGYAANHPARIVLRTYGLALTLTLGPTLVPFITKLVTSQGRKFDGKRLAAVLTRGLRHDGFAFGITTAVAGGHVLRCVWGKVVDALEGNIQLQPEYAKLKALYAARLRKIGAGSEQAAAFFAFNVVASTIGFLLLRSGRRRLQKNPKHGLKALPTLDFTLLLVVRALDAAVQSFIHDHCASKEVPPICDNGTKIQNDTPRGSTIQHVAEKVGHCAQKTLLSSQVDAIVLWLSSSRIMWCWFYEPSRLPGSYVRWIMALANLDPRIPEALRLIREKKWSYIHGSQSHAHVLQDYAKELGYPASWGNPTLLPAYGGAAATRTWETLGATSRPGVGGVPCELVHGRLGQAAGLQGNCHSNAALRARTAFIQALAIYLPVHFIPLILTRPRSLLDPSSLIQTSRGALRSSAFLSAFIALYYYSVCFTRSIFLAKLLPFISHDFWDGPYGCALAGSLSCGASIWIENGRRRGEMALYVLPRALRTFLPQDLSKRGLRRFARIAESGAFVLSISYLLHIATKRPDSLRGLSRWALGFVLNGSKSRKSDTIPETIVPDP